MKLPLHAHLDDDALIDLAHGLARDAQPALAHLRACPACDARFRSEVGRMERLRARGAPPEHRALPARPRRAAASVALVAAALALLGLSWLALERRASPPNAAHDFALPIELEPTRMRDDAATASEALAPGLAAYARGDIAEARRLLEGLASQGAREDLRLLYLSSCLALQARYAEALELLERVELDAVPDPWRSSARWIEVGLCTALDRDERARALLVELRNEGGPLAERAGRELARLPPPRASQSLDPISSNPDQ